MNVIDGETERDMAKRFRNVVRDFEKAERKADRREAFGEFAKLLIMVGCVVLVWVLVIVAVTK